MLNSAQKIKLDIYTDGSYLERQDIGGWGLIIYKDHQECYRTSGWQKKTSSLEMELTAAKVALQQLKSANLDLEKNQITLHTDSRILIEGLTEKYSLWCENQWKVKSGKTVIYKELWQSLKQLEDEQEVSFCWVKGHNGNQGNTIADQLAREALEKRSK